jgi:hypothetical protein
MESVCLTDFYILADNGSGTDHGDAADIHEYVPR